MDVPEQKKIAGAAEHPPSCSGDSCALQPGTRQRSSGTAGRFSRGFKGIAVALLIACIFALPSAIRAAKKNASDVRMTPVEEKAADFVLADLKGKKFRLSDHWGKRPVLIIFSTTWCTFCKAEIPHFKSLYATYARQGLEVVNIDIQESKEKVAKFASQNQLPYRVLLDEDGAVSGVYEIRGVPTMILVDKNGMVICRQCRTVETVLETILKK
jgi:peroxiredoxin